MEQLHKKSARIWKNQQECKNLKAINQLDLISRVHSAQQQAAIFLTTPGTFSRIHHMLGHKTRLSNFKRTKIIQSLFSDHNGTNLENKKRKFKNSTSIWRSKTYFYITHGSKKWQGKLENRKYFEVNENENKRLKFMSSG